MKTLDAEPVPAASLSLPQLVAHTRWRLAGRTPQRLPVEPGQRAAAVVLALLERRDVPCVLVIKRVARGKHAGQWALPGGRVDRGETSAAAALRELEEETGLRCGLDRVLGRLDDIATGSGHVITPWVVTAAGCSPPRRSPAEVASLHPIPVSRLVAPGVPRWRQAEGAMLLQMPLRHDMVVHAPTGAILWQYAEVVLRGRDTGIDDLVEPAFVSH